MCANLDQYTPPNKTKLDKPNKAKNNVSQVLIFENCKKDHTRAKVEVIISANTNKSAWMMQYLSLIPNWLCRRLNPYR